MRWIAKATVVLLLVIALAGVADAGGLLKGVGKKDKQGPSLGYLLRDDLKQQFKKVMTAYLAEDLDAYVGYFDEEVTIASRAIYGQKVKTTRDTLKAQVKKEFARNDFTKVQFDEAFDMNAPTMLFVMSEEQMHDSIPVWGFSITPKEIVKYMPKGSFVVIATVLPSVYDKNINMPGTKYIIFRKDGDKLIATGIE